MEDLTMVRTIEYDGRNIALVQLMDLFQTLGGRFVETKPAKEQSQYSPEFVAKIKKSQREARQGKAKAVKLEDLWK